MFVLPKKIDAAPPDAPFSLILFAKGCQIFETLIFSNIVSLKGSIRKSERPKSLPICSVNTLFCGNVLLNEDRKNYYINNEP
jgi:hypothetical protein